MQTLSLCNSSDGFWIIGWIYLKIIKTKTIFFFLLFIHYEWTIFVFVYSFFWGGRVAFSPPLLPIPSLIILLMTPRGWVIHCIYSIIFTVLTCSAYHWITFNCIGLIKCYSFHDKDAILRLISLIESRKFLHVLSLDIFKMLRVSFVLGTWCKCIGCCYSSFSY